MNDKDKALDRSKPPLPGKPKDIIFPEYYDIVTQDGINLLVIENYRIPSVSVRLVFRNAGSFFDNDKAGISQLTAELLTKGTINRKATEIADEVDFIGASLSSGSDWDGSYVSLTTLKKHLDKGIDILADVVQNPVFSEDEIERLREQRISSIIQMKDDPGTLSDRLFNKLIFDKTPYALPVEGTIESIQSIQRTDILNFYNQNFIPGNLIIAFVGAITREEAVNYVTNKFIHWKLIDSENSHPEYNYTMNDDRDRLHLIHKDGAVQSNLKIGHLGIKRNNKDFIGLSVLNMILGGYFRSRINMNLREKNGYTYGAHSGFNSRIYPGDFSVDTDVRSDVTHLAVREILTEMEKIQKENISDEELQAVKNYMTGIFPLQLETANAVATRVINLKLYDLPKDFYSTYVTKINMLTAGELNELANKYLSPDNARIVVTGNASEIKDKLKELGKVTVYDQDLNIIEND